MGLLNKIKDFGSSIVDAATKPVTAATEAITSAVSGGSSGGSSNSDESATESQAPSGYTYEDEGGWRDALNNVSKFYLMELCEKYGWNVEDVWNAIKDDQDLINRANSLLGGQKLESLVLNNEKVKQMLDQYGGTIPEGSGGQQQVEGSQTSEEQAAAEAAGDTYTVDAGSSNLSQEQATKLQEEAADLSNATNTAEQESSTTAQGVQTSAINAGLNKSKAGMLGANQGTSTTSSNTLNNYSANSSQRASTQADYLEKMAQANAANLQAQNLNKSAGLIGISGALQGAGSGASMGASISDERCKEAPEKFDDNKLLEAVQQFFELKRRLDDLKKERK